MNWSSAPIPVPGKPLLTLAEVAIAVGYHEKTIQRWIKEGTFPAAKRIGDGKRWTAMSIGVWLAWQDFCPATDENDAPNGDSGEVVKSKS